MIRLVLQHRCQMHQGMYRQRAKKAWEHTAHRGWAGLLVIISHGPVHRGANGAAMPTDEDGQDGHFFFDRPERGRRGGMNAKKELKLELIQTQMAQKLRLRGEVGARALRVRSESRVKVWASAGVRRALG